MEIFIHVFFDLRNRLCAVRPNALKELKMKKRSATHHGIFSQPGLTSFGAWWVAAAAAAAAVSQVVIGSG